ASSNRSGPQSTSASVRSAEFTGPDFRGVSGTRIHPTVLPSRRESVLFLGGTTRFRLSGLDRMSTEKSRVELSRQKTRAASKGRGGEDTSGVLSRLSDEAGDKYPSSCATWSGSSSLAS